MVWVSGGGVEEVISIVVYQWLGWAVIGVGGVGVGWLWGGSEYSGDVSGDLLEYLWGLGFPKEAGGEVI